VKPNSLGLGQALSPNMYEPGDLPDPTFLGLTVR